MTRQSVRCGLGRAMVLLCAAGLCAAALAGNADAGDNIPPAMAEPLGITQAAAKSRELYEQSRFDEALPWARQALELAQRGFGDEHPEAAAALHMLGRILKARADYPGAESAYLRAIAIREKALGLEHPDLARTLNNLAILYQDLGDYQQADALYRRSLAILDSVLGPNSVLAATTLGNLGGLQGDFGNYPEAERMLSRSLQYLEQALGPEHPDVAGALGELAEQHRKMGDFDRAEALRLRSAAIYEKALGPADPQFARSLNNLAIVYQNQGRAAMAQPLLQRSLAIWEQSLGEHHPHVAAALHNLANAYREQGDYRHAMPLQRRSVAITRDTWGPDHPMVALTQSNLADLYRDEGDTASAEALYQRSLAIWEASLDPWHPYTATTLTDLAALAWSRQELPRALAGFQRAAAIEERNLQLVLASGSEQQKQAYAKLLQSQTDFLISRHLESQVPNVEMARLAATDVLRRKGRVLDAVSEATGALRRQLAPADQTLLDQLGAVRAERARQMVTMQDRLRLGAGLSAQQLDEQRTRGAGLEAQQQALEARISQRSAEFRSSVEVVTLEQVQQALPADAALIEWIVYRPIDVPRKPLAEDAALPRYAAFVLRARGDPVWLDLGPAERVDSQVSRFRSALADPARRDSAALAQQLSQQVFEPLRPHLDGIHQLLLSPDAALNLIPFASLQDAAHHHLLEQFTLSYLGTGRDLLRASPQALASAVPRQSARHPGLLLAAPDFDAAPISAASVPAAGARTRGPGEDRLPWPFSPLPATQREARAIHRLLPRLALRVGASASKTLLQQVSGPRILHIATHGFFLDAPRDAQAARAQDALLRAGLALAGANRLRDGRAGDGILSALELAGLDLWGTQLVVLSACDTGIGEVRSGEGVYGLRRALAMAGSQSQVMSLWKIDDEATRELMVDYYARLVRSQGRAEALRQVQLKLMRRKPPFDHPYYWASFISAGAWGPLELPSR